MGKDHLPGFNLEKDTIICFGEKPREQWRDNGRLQFYYLMRICHPKLFQVLVGFDVETLVVNAVPDVAYYDREAEVSRANRRVVEEISKLRVEMPAKDCACCGKRID
jgi:hypothetical protein